jgi:hypothetical protein
LRVSSGITRRVGNETAFEDYKHKHDTRPDRRQGWEYP